MDGLTQIGRAVPAAHRIAELVAAAGNTPCAGRRQHGIGRNLPALQRGHAHKWFESRAGGIQSLSNAVDERFLPIIIQAFPGIAVDAVDKQVGIVSRLRYQRQYPAGLRIDGHHRAAPVAQQFAGFLLHADIQRQAQGLPAHGRGGFQGTHNIALRVFFHLLIAGHTVQLLLVIVFQAHFADMGGAAIKLIAVFAFQLVAVFVADAANITDDMSGELAVGIFAESACVHFHTFETE